MDNGSILVLLILINLVYFGYLRLWRKSVTRWRDHQKAQIKESEDVLNEKITKHNINVNKLSADLKAQGIAKEKELFKIALQQNKQMLGLCLFVMRTISGIPAGAVDASDKVSTIAQLQEYIDDLQVYIERDELHLSEISK